MTIPREIIEQAIQGGWVGIDLPAPSMFNWSEKRHKENYKRACGALNALDPLFWQALGKSVGWNEHGTKYPSVWFYQATTFYELILTGGNTDAFWASLLTTPKENI